MRSPVPVLAEPDPSGLGIYVHWPFCQAKCPYCDFNSHVSARIDQSAWVAAYLREIDRYGTVMAGRIVTSIFFGGGTPSLMAATTVDAVVDRIRRTWRTANDVEITLEANPTSVEAGRFAGFRAAGVNRISMGIQALNDADLSRLGRLHTAKEALAAFDVARSQFDRVSFDLIYARQDQTVAEWKAELQTALSLAADHLSLYQLTVEPGTAFGDRAARGGLRGLPDDDLGADLYAMTQSICEAAGLPAYEVSNHAAAGAESRHNMTYWTGGDYVGIGPGAHGRLTQDGRRIATEAIRAPAPWLAAVRSGEGDRTEVLAPADVAHEALVMGLRVRNGVAKSRIPADFLNLTGLQDAVDLGLVVDDPERLRLSDAGRPLLDAVLRSILK